MRSHRSYSVHFTLGNYCSKLGQVNVPLSPVLFFKIWRGHFFFCARRAKIRQAFIPFEGKWYNYTISSRKIPNPRGKRFLLIPSLPYSVQFSRIMTFLKKHFDTIFNPRISGSSGLWKVIFLSLLSPNSEKVKPYFPRKGIYLSFL